MGLNIQGIVAVLLLISHRVYSSEMQSRARRDAGPDCNHPVDIAFIVDASGSISAKDYQLQKDFIKAVADVNKLSESGAHMGVVLFSITSSVAIKFNEYFDVAQFKEGVQLMKHEFSITRIDKGLKTAYDMLFTRGYGSRYDAPRVAFLLTDGEQTKYPGYMEPFIAALPLKDIGVKLFAIGIGLGAKRDELETITGSKDNVYMIRNYKKLLDKDMLARFTYSCSPEILEKVTSSVPTVFPMTRPSPRLTKPKEGPKTPLEPMKTYYINVDVRNNKNNAIELQWMENGEMKKMTVPPRSRKRIAIEIKSRTYPLPVRLRAFEKKNGKVLEIRDRDNLLLIPRTKRYLERIVFEPDSKVGYINWLAQNYLQEDVNLVWQQQGKRQTMRIPKRTAKRVNIKFDRTLGLSPVTFRAYTVKKNLPVKVGRSLDIERTPTIRPRFRRLQLKKAVRDFFMRVVVENKVAEAIDVKWTDEDGKETVFTVPRKGRVQKFFALRDRLKAKPIEFKSFIIGTDEPVTLNGRANWMVRPWPRPKPVFMRAEKKTYIDLEVDNQTPDDILVKWKDKDGKEKSLEVKSGSKAANDFVFSGPDAKEPLKFYAVDKITGDITKLNDTEETEVVPQYKKKKTLLVVKKKHYLDLKVENRAANDVVVKWTQDGQPKSMEVPRGEDKIKEMVFEGPDARKRIKFNAVIKGTNIPAELNGKPEVEFESMPEKMLNIVRLDKKYYLNVDVINKLPEPIVVSWHENGKQKTLEVPAKFDGKIRAVLDGPDADKPVKFSAVAKSTNEPVELNETDSVTFTPTLDEKKMNTAVAESKFYLDVEVTNEAPDPITVKWQEKGVNKTMDIAPGEKKMVEMVFDGLKTDKPVKFDAVVKGSDQVVPLNRQDDVEFKPTKQKVTQKAVASIYKLRLINKASGDVTAKLQIGPDLQRAKVPFKGTEEKYIDLDGLANAMELSGIVDETQREVSLNGSKKLEVIRDDKNKVITVILEDRICDMKVDAIFVLDTSGSVLPEQHQKQKDFIKRFAEINELNKDGLHAGVIVFSQSSSVEIKLNDYYNLNAFMAAVQKLKQECSVTRIDKGLKQSYDLLLSKSYGARDGVPKVLFILLDGKQTQQGNYIEPNVAAKPIQDAGVLMKAIGIGNEIDRKELESIAGSIDNVYLIRNYKKLSEKSFMESFNFNCDPKTLLPPVLIPGLEPTPAALRDFGEPTNYCVKLDVRNELNKAVILQHEEGGVPKELEVPPKTDKVLDIEMIKPFYPDPVTFRAVDKITGAVIKLRGREKLDVIPRKVCEVERVDLLPESGKAYLDVDVKNELDEPIVIKWQEDGETKSVTVPAKTTKTIEREFDLAKPGALSPKTFKGYTKDGNKPVDVNGKKSESFTPSIKKKKENVVVSPHTKDSYIIIYVINNAREDVEVAWKRGDINHVIRVPNGKTRYHEIVFDKRKGETPLTFTGHSYMRGKDFKVALNGTDSHTFRPTLKKKVNTLIVGGDLKKIELNFINKAGGPVKIAWLEKDLDKKLSLAKGEKVKKTFIRIGEDAMKSLLFRPKRTDAKTEVLINGEETGEFNPAVDESGKTFIVTDIPRFVLADFKNEAFSPVEISWLENGKKKTLEVQPGETVGKELISFGKEALKSVTFKGKYKKYDDPVSLNDSASVSITPTKEKIKYLVVIKDEPKYVLVDLVNNASGPISFEWKEKGADKTIDVEKGKKKRREIVLIGEDAYKPLTITGKRSDKYFPVKLNNKQSVQLTPTLQKPLHTVIATDEGYLVPEFINNATGPIEVKWKIDGKDDSLVVQPGKRVRKEIVFKEADSSKKVTFKATRLDNGEPIKLNDADDVTFQITPDKTVQTAIAKDIQRYLVPEFVNKATGPIEVKWTVDGKEHSVIVPPGKSVRREIVFSNGDPDQAVTFTAMRKDNGEPIKLNDANNVTFQVTPDKKVQQAVAKDIPRYLVPEFVNKASGPIEVKWNVDGREDSVIVPPGKSVRKEMMFLDGDPDKKVTFTATRKDNGLPIKLNYANDVTFQVTPDKKVQQAVAEDAARYLVPEFINKASGPIEVKWAVDGKEDSVIVQSGKRARKEMVFLDGDPNKKVKFTATRKDNGEPIKLNNEGDVTFQVTLDKKVQQAVAKDIPRYLVPEFVNKASGPIEVKWTLDGKEDSVIVPPGKSVRKEIIFLDGDPNKKVKFIATRKDNGEPIKLNDEDDVTFQVTPDKKVQQAVAKDIPRYLVPEFVNKASGPIEVKWTLDGKEDSVIVPPGKSVHKEMIFLDGDPNKKVKFIATRKDNGEPIKLNDEDDVTFQVTPDKKVQQAVAKDIPRYLVPEFVNKASGPIEVKWTLDGKEDSVIVPPGKSVRKEMIFLDGDPNKKVKFIATRKDNGEPIKLNDEDDVTFQVTPDKKVQQAVAKDIPRYLVPEFVNKASGPIEVKWTIDRKEDSVMVPPGESVRKEMEFLDGDPNKKVKFTATRKDNGEPIKLNDEDDVTFQVTPDKKVQQAVAKDIPRYLVPEFVNKASGPIEVKWNVDGKEDSVIVPPGQIVRKEMVFLDGDPNKKVKFTATRKDNGEPIKLNDEDDVTFQVTPDKKVQQAVAKDIPRYLVPEFVNKASGPIEVKWNVDGKEDSVIVPPGQIVRKEMVFLDGDPNKKVKFTATRKDNGEPIKLNDEDDVTFQVTPDKKVQQAVAKDIPRYLVPEFVNKASGPIEVKWTLDGKEDSVIVPPGKSARKEMTFLDGDPNKKVKFIATRKDNGEPIKLNDEDDVTFQVTPDKKVQQAVAKDIPRYLVPEFVNRASGPIKVKWNVDGKEDSVIVPPGQSVRKEMVFLDGDPNKKVKFTATRKDNGEPIKLNDEDDVTFQVTPDKKVQQAVAKDIPRYLVPEFVNKASGPIEVKWTIDRKEDSVMVPPGESVRKEMEFLDGDPNKKVKFTATRKDNGEPIKLNDEDDVTFQVTPDKKVQQAVAKDIPRYLVPEFVNKASGPIEVKWTVDGKKDSVIVPPGKSVRKEMVFLDGDPNKKVKFIATRKDNGEPIKLNDLEDVTFQVTQDKKVQEAVAKDIPRYLVPEFINKASGPIEIKWTVDGKEDSVKVPSGESVRKEMVFLDGDSNKKVKFTATRKDNGEPIKLNDLEDVTFQVTPDKKVQEAVAKDIPRYLVPEFINKASGPIEVKWTVDGKEDSVLVPPGESVRKEMVFLDGDPNKKVKFTATRKDNGEPIKLNDLEDVTFQVTPDKKVQEAVAKDIPRYLVPEFINKASGPIEVKWTVDGKEDSVIVPPGESVRKEMVFLDGDPNKKVKFTATRKDNGEPIKLNDLEDVTFQVTPDKKVQQAVAKDIPRYLVPEFINKASGPIEVKWTVDGKEDSVIVPPGESVRKEMVFLDGDPNKKVKFTATRKDNGEPIKLNDLEDVTFQVTPDKKVQQAVAKDIPRYLVPEFINKASGPIEVKWTVDGKEDSVTVPPGDSVRKEMIFLDGDPNKKVKFTATRKDNGEPIKLNDLEDVTFQVTQDKKVQQAVAKDIPRYLVPEFINKASGPIEVKWTVDGMEDSVTVPPEDNVRKEMIFLDGDPNKKVKFTATRKDNGEPIKLNDLEDVTFQVTPDKKVQQAVAKDIPRYLVPEFINKASGPIEVKWTVDGKEDSVTVPPGDSVRKEMIFLDGDPNKKVKFTATRKDNGEPIKLNDLEDVTFQVTPDKKVQEAVAKDIPRYLVPEFINKASGPIEVKWTVDGKEDSVIVPPGESVRKEMVFLDGDPNKKVKFTATRKDNGEPIKLNDLEDVTFQVTPDKKVQQAVAKDIPRYLVPEFINKASGPIEVKWTVDGKEDSVTVPPGDSVRKEMIFLDGDPNKKVKFTATRKDNGEPIKLNDLEDVTFQVTPDKKVQQAVAKDIPRYLVPEFINKASGPIEVKWTVEGKEDSVIVPSGESVRKEMVFLDGDPNKKVKFTATRKDNGEPIKLNDLEDVTFQVTPDKKVQEAVAKDIPRYLVPEFINKASGPIEVKWTVDGKVDSVIVPPGDSVRKEMIFLDGDPNKKVKFTATRKDNGEPIKLNDEDDVTFQVTTDKKVQQAVAKDIPRFLIVDLINNSSLPITVEWKVDGKSKSVSISPGETVHKEMVFFDGDPNKKMKFSARRILDNEPVLLNNAEDVTFAVTADKKVQKAIATNAPRHIFLDIINKAAGPVDVRWTEDGKEKSQAVALGGKKRVELVFKDGDAKKELTFKGKRKDIEDEPVKLDDVFDLKKKVSLDKRVHKVVVTDRPWYIIADIANNADGEVYVTWDENGTEQTFGINPAASAKRETVFKNKDESVPAVLKGNRKDTDEPVNLNDSPVQMLPPTPDRTVNELIITDVKKSIVLDLVNRATGPVHFFWLEKGVPKIIKVDQGKTKRERVTLEGRDARQPIVFTARREDFDFPIKVNGADMVELTPSLDEKVHRVVATDEIEVIPWLDEGSLPEPERYLIVDLVNKATRSVLVTPAREGQEKAVLVGGRTTKRVAMIFQGSKAANPVFFRGRMLDFGLPVKLNDSFVVKLKSTVNKKVHTLIIEGERTVLPWFSEGQLASDANGGTPNKYITVDLKNEAGGPVVIASTRDGKTEEFNLLPGETRKLSVIFREGKSAPILFQGKRTDTGNAVTLNHRPEVLYLPRYEQVVETIIARDRPKYVAVDLVNKAGGPVLFKWSIKGKKDSLEVAKGASTLKELQIRGDDSQEVVFTGIRTDTGIPVKVNGKDSVGVTPKYNRDPETVIATDSPQYIAVDLVNEARGPVVFSWTGNGAEIQNVALGKTERKTFYLDDKTGRDPMSFIAKRSDTQVPVSVNYAESVQVEPSFEKTVTRIVARDAPDSFDIDFKNEGTGPGVVSSTQNGDALQVPQGKTVRKTINLKDRLNPFEKIGFTAKREDIAKPMTLNDQTNLELVPAIAKSPVLVILKDAPRYLDVIFRNDAPGPITVSWPQDGGQKELTIPQGESVPLSLVLPAQDENEPFKFSSKFVALPGVVFLNNAATASATPTYTKSKPKLIIATSPHVFVNFINAAKNPANVKWNERGSPKNVTVPAGRMVPKLIFFDKPKDSVVMSGVMKSKDQEFVALLNDVESLPIQEDATNLQRYVEIVPGRNKLFFGVNATNEMDKDATVRFELNGKKIELPVPAKSTNKILLETSDAAPVSVDGVRNDNGDKVLLNNEDTATFSPTKKKIYHKVVIRNDKQYTLLIRAINLLQQDTVLKWNQNGDREEAIVPKEATIEKPITYTDVQSPIDFRSFVKGTRIPTSVNRRRSYVYNHQESPENRVIEVEIDLDYFLGITVVNNGHEDAFVKWKVKGKDKSLFVKAKGKARRMMTIHGGNPKPVAFSAYSKENNKQLAVNREKSVQFRPRLHKFYNFIRIDDHFTHEKFYVVLDVKNIAREDAKIVWLQDGVEKSQDCPQTQRCLISFEIPDKDGSGVTKPIEFSAISKKTGRKLNMNREPSIFVTPTHYRRIQRALIEAPDKLPTTRYINVHASNMKNRPITVLYMYDGKRGYIKVDPKGEKKGEIIIPRPPPESKVLFQAYDTQTGESYRVNELPELPYKTRKARSLVLLLLGEKVSAPASIGQLDVHPCQDQKVDVLFLLDNSNTLEYAFKVAREFLKRLVGYFRLSPAGTRASVILFAGKYDTYMPIRFSDYFDNKLFDKAVDELKFASGKTRIDLGLKIASTEAFKVENGARPKYPKLVFLLSDGRQEPSIVNGRWINIRRLSYPLYKVATNVVSIAIFGERPVDIGTLQMISRKRDNVYNPGNIDVITSDIFIRHIFGKYCHV